MALRLQTTFSILTALIAAGTATAQLPVRVLALPDGGLGLLTVSQTCGFTTCPATMGPVPNQHAGGVAHDPRDRHTWISNGLLLAKVDPRNACSVKCAPFPAPNLGIGQVVTGLAYNEETNRLFVSHSPNVILTYSVAANGCALTLLNQCTVTVPTNHTICGLATDDANQRLYYVTYAWLGTSGNVFAEFWAAPQSNPCAPTCGPFFVSDCAANPPVPIQRVTGLAFDSCGAGGGTLLVTNALSVTAVQVSGCVATPVACCPTLLPGLQVTGLCVLPVDEVVSFGPGCSAGTPTCSPLHTMRGDSTIGNLAFALDLSNAPGSSIATLWFNVGACAPSLNAGICQLVPPNMLCVPGFTTGTLNQCNGTRSCPLPIPNIPAFCSVQISTMWWGIDQNLNWANNYASNCLTWTICAS